jgi:hypothetical protein
VKDVGAAENMDMSPILRMGSFTQAFHILISVGHFGCNICSSGLARLRTELADATAAPPTAIVFTKPLRCHTPSYFALAVNVGFETGAQAFLSCGLLGAPASRRPNAPKKNSRQPVLR